MSVKEKQLNLFLQVLHGFAVGISTRDQQEEVVELEQLCHLAEYYHLESFFYYFLRQELPEKLREKYSSICQGIFGQSLRQSCMLAELKQLFNREGIRFLPFKGADLATRIYPDPVLRPMGDLDILIHPDDCRRACRVLDRKEWRSEELETEHHYPPRHRNGVTLELHRNLPGFHSPDIVSLWKELEIVDYCEYRLPPELNLLMLVSHSRNHEWRNGLRMVIDLDWLFQNSVIESEKVEKLHQKYHLTKPDIVLAAFPELFRSSPLWQSEWDGANKRDDAAHDLRLLIAEYPDFADRFLELAWLEQERFSKTWWKKRLTSFRPAALRKKYHFTSTGLKDYLKYLGIDINRKFKKSFYFFCHSDTQELQRYNKYKKHLKNEFGESQKSLTHNHDK